MRNLTYRVIQRKTNKYVITNDCDLYAVILFGNPLNKEYLFYIRRKIR